VALADVIDALVEAPIGPSFTRVGYEVRSRLEHWRALDSYRADGRVVVLTGATSGLGLAAAEQLARCGATVVLIGRDAERCERVRSELSARTGNTSLSTLVADLGDLAAVRGAAAELQRRYSVIDVLVHNAGASRACCAIARALLRAAAWRGGGARRKRAGGRERAEENASVSVCVLPSVCECVHLCTCVCAPCDGATSSGADAANLSSGFQLRILLLQQ
jgi:hypothetical protein